MTTRNGIPGPPTLRARRLGLFTQHESIVIMRTDCHVCRSEGLRSRSQVMLCSGGREVYAILYQIDDSLLKHDEAALSEAAWHRLGVKEGDAISVRHPPESSSLSSVRRRIYGNRLDETALRSIIDDIAAGRYTDVHMAAFLTACSALPLDDEETVALVRAMVDVGDKLSWPSSIVVDKHCVGGLPGNRTTPIIVAIAAASGLLMPKTSSRAITSPAGTADVMETLAPVNLDLATLRTVVEAEGGCIAWGGSVQLSPADDIFIQIERELDIDAEGQLIASVLSKKIAAGSTHVVIDVPVGPTAKVRSEETGKKLATRLASVGEHFGLKIRCHSQKFTNNPNEKFLLMILCSQAKLENDNRGINVKRGQKARAEQGYRPCLPSLGYLTERRAGEVRSRIIIDPVRAPFVKQMFEKVAQDRMSGRDVYRWVRQSEFRTRAGKDLTLSMIYKVLHNPFYTGRFEYPVGSGRWYRGDYDPIINQQLFDDVQRYLSAGQEREWGTKEFAFTRLMMCGNCGSGVTADEKRKQTKKGLQRYVYYRCTHSRDLQCKEQAVREEELIEQLIELLDGLNLNTSAVKRKIDDEFERFSKFATDVLGISDKQKAQKINQRKYVEYLLRNGAMEEKRALLDSLRNRLILKNGKVSLEQTEK